MVSQLTISFIIFAMTIGIEIPLILAIVIRRKYKITTFSFWIGCAVMFVFAFILEQILHIIILSSPVGEVIQNNIWLYAIYGGLAAGLFEESGRFLAMKYILKSKHDDSHNAIMYGAGHGGLEALFILTFGMLNNLIYSLAINNNQLDLITMTLDDSSKQAFLEVVEQLKNTSSWIFLLSPVERIAAVIAQIALSVLVWFAVTKGKTYLYGIAIGLHFFLDFFTALLNGYGTNVFVIEVFVWVIAVGIAVFARKIWNENSIAPAVDNKAVKS